MGMGPPSASRFLAQPAPVLDVRYAVTQVWDLYVDFSFRARWSPFICGFLLSIHRCSQSCVCCVRNVYCQKSPIPARDPSKKGDDATPRLRD